MSKQAINPCDLFSDFGTSRLKMFLLTLKGPLYVRFLHLVLGGELFNLTFHSTLLGRIFVLVQIQLQELFIHLLDCIGHGMPLTKLSQRSFCPILVHQQHLPPFVRVMPPAVENLHDPIPFLGAVLIQLNALLLKFGLLVIICLFLGVLKCLSGILQISL